MFATIDAFDLHVFDHVWYCVRDGHTCYAFTSAIVEGVARPLSMHRLLLGFPQSCIDHRDGDGLNNTRNNLRLATRSQNQFNRRKTEGRTSVFKGVRRLPNGKFQVSISRDNGQRRWSRVFSIEETAARAYDIKAAEWFGDFARLNFPGELSISARIVTDALLADKHTKLTAPVVRLIREMAFDGHSASQIAHRFNVNQKTVESVIQRRSWKNIDNEVAQ
jgi:hypothetical protein